MQVYLAIYLQSNPLEEKAVVMSMGEKAFTVHVPRLGITSRIYLDKIPDVVAAFNEVEGMLELRAASTATHAWTSATLKILSKVLVRCVVAAKAGPIETLLEFVRPM